MASSESDRPASTVGPILVADAVVSVLARAGIDACFGVPGGQTLPIYGAAARSGFRHILMRDERNAACAADAYARVTGRVGVCDATVGPGMTNLVTGLAEAYASSIPVLALIADIQSSREHLRARGVASQALKQGPVLEPVSKWIGRVHVPDAIEDVLDHALRVATTTGRPGPVVVEIPEEVVAAPAAPSSPPRVFGPGSAAWPRYRPAAQEDSLSEAVDLLKTARRVVVLAGGGAVSSGAAQEITRFADELHIPVATTISGKGSIDERHPLSLGVVGVFGNIAASTTVMQADVVIMFGSKVAQFSSFLWRVPSPEQAIIHVDIDGEEIGRTGPVAVGIQADVREAARQLLERLGALGRDFGWAPDPHPVDVPETIPALGTVDPSLVVDAVSEALSPDGVFVSDASLASGWAASGYRVKAVGRSFLAPRGLAGIGWSGGAAIGTAIGAPGRRVVALAGDGAAAYWLAEIETAVRFRLPIVYVILNNSAFGWVVQGEGARGISTRSSFGTVDFAGAARALGASGESVSDVEGFVSCLAKALEATGPSLIDVCVDVACSPSVDYGWIVPSAASEGGAYGMG